MGGGKRRDVLRQDPQGMFGATVAASGAAQAVSFCASGIHSTVDIPWILVLAGAPRVRAEVQVSHHVSKSLGRHRRHPERSLGGHSMLCRAATLQKVSASRSGAAPDHSASMKDPHNMAL